MHFRNQVELRHFSAGVGGQGPKKENLEYHGFDSLLLYVKASHLLLGYLTITSKKRAGSSQPFTFISITIFHVLVNMYISQLINTIYHYILICHFSQTTP